MERYFLFLQTKYDYLQLILQIFLLTRANTYLLAD